MKYIFIRLGIVVSGVGLFFPTYFTEVILFKYEETDTDRSRNLSKVTQVINNKP